MTECRSGGCRLADLIREAPIPFDPASADDRLGELRTEARASLPEAGDLLDEPRVRALLHGILGCSPYLTGLVRRDPARLLRLLAAPPQPTLAPQIRSLEAAIADAASAEAAMQQLRRFKSEVALLVALCDLGGVWPVHDVTAALTAAADAATGACVRFLFRQAAARGDVAPVAPERPEAASGYIVIAMGKHGARELNYSSDIDLIVFYEPGVARLRQGLEPLAFFVRQTRELVKLLQERTADGYVFRTDLRLRPDPGSTQVAISTPAALNYYESFGQNWERAALIKARPIAGDLAAGEAFLKDLTPFIWRKYLGRSSFSCRRSSSSQAAASPTCAHRRRSMRCAGWRPAAGSRTPLPTSSHNPMPSCAASSTACR
jgi:glutamate-ammonia-ligase adenylyltransferase